MLSRNDQTGEVSPQSVVNTSTLHADATVAVHLDSGAVLKCTPDHAIYAEELGIGTELVTRAGPSSMWYAKVTKIERLSGQTVHNLAVQNFFTYYVGDKAAPGSWTWVHNNGCAAIALGRDPYFKTLAQKVGAYRYRQWASAGITRRTISAHFGRAFHQAAQKASKIHFALDDIGDVAEAARKGAAGFKLGNMTNAELNHIMNTPDLLKKTIFYLGGVPLH